MCAGMTDFRLFEARVDMDNGRHKYFDFPERVLILTLVSLNAYIGYVPSESLKEPRRCDDTRMTPGDSLGNCELHLLPVSLLHMCRRDT